MGAWADIRFPTYQEAAMNCTEEFIAKMKQKDIVIQLKRIKHPKINAYCYCRCPFLDT